MYAGGGDLHRMRLLKVCRGEVKTSDMKKEKERKVKKKRMKRTRPWERRVVDNAEQKVAMV